MAAVLVHLLECRTRGELLALFVCVLGLHITVIGDLAIVIEASNGIRSVQEPSRNRSRPGQVIIGSISVTAMSEPARIESLVFRTDKRPNPT
jgi:hypothetical protein